jgi:hypothetical protein
MGPRDIAGNGLSIHIDVANGDFGAFTIPAA